MTEQELYNATESSFWLNKAGPNKLQALVFIKSFSTHQLDIVVGAAVNQTQTTAATATTTGTSVTTTATPTPGFGLVMGVIAAIVAVYLVKRKS
ncbi:Uncharacterised protein [uncultured archaeon]|nr:Uncharacterised protein [uncultured archaeon]